MVRGERQRLPCEPAAHDEGVPGSQELRQTLWQAGDRLLVQVEVLVACSLTTKMRYICRHTARRSGARTAHRKPLPSNICSMGRHQQQHTCWPTRLAHHDVRSRVLMSVDAGISSSGGVRRQHAAEGSTVKTTKKPPGPVTTERPCHRLNLAKLTRA